MKKIEFLGEKLSRLQAVKALESIIDRSLSSMKANDYQCDSHSKIREFYLSKNADGALLEIILDKYALVTKNYPTTTEDVVMHKNFPTDRLTKLYDSKDKNVLRGLIHNPNTDVEVLKRLMKSRSEDVRAAFSYRKNLDDEMIQSIFNFRTDHPLSCLASFTNDEKLLEKILDQNPSDNVKREIASNENCNADLLNRLSQEKDEYVRRDVATNPKSDFQAINRIIKVSTESDVLAQAVMHKNFTIKEAEKVVLSNKNHDLTLWCKAKLALNQQDNEKIMYCVPVEAGHFIFAEVANLRNYKYDSTGPFQNIITVPKGHHYILIFILGSISPIVRELEVNLEDDTDFVLSDSCFIIDDYERFLEETDIDGNVDHFKSDIDFEGLIFETGGDNFFDVGVFISNSTY